MRFRWGGENGDWELGLGLERERSGIVGHVGFVGVPVQRRGERVRELQRSVRDPLNGFLSGRNV